MLKRNWATGCAAVLALGLSACGGGSSATDVDATSTLDVNVHEGDFAQIASFTTPGGVSVWLVDEPSIPIVSFQVAWPGGRSADPEGLEGLSQALVYMMNEGAGELPSLEFTRAMEDQAMSFGCSNGRTWTSCSASMLSESAEESMELVALAMSEPRFDEQPFERFRREQDVSLARRETNAGFLGNEALQAALYPDHPFARNVTAESLEALTREAIATQKDAVMVKEGMIVTAVGDISPEEFAPLIDSVLAGLPETGSVADVAPVEMSDPTAAPIVVDLPQPQSRVSFMAKGPSRDDPDFYPSVVLNYTLGGGGFESRLMQELRVDRGLTYGVGTSLSGAPLFSTWSGGGQTKNESTGEFIEVLKSILAEMSETGVTEAELSDAKAYLTGSYPLSFDSNSKIAGNMMSVRQQGLGIAHFDQRNAKIEAVTLDDVKRVAETYLSPENFTFAVVGQPEGL
ncbi:MAG: pitrilysin family protein [Pseudomonadota bacterium]